MNLKQTIDLFGGGPGSGPNAPCPQCGPGKNEGHEGPHESFKVYTSPVGNKSAKYKSIPHPNGNELAPGKKAIAFEVFDGDKTLGKVMNYVEDVEYRNSERDKYLQHRGKKIMWKVVHPDRYTSKGFSNKDSAFFALVK